MPAVARVTLAHPVALSSGWTMTVLPADSAALPNDAFTQAEKHSPWIEARVPGTAAQALASAGRDFLTLPTLHDSDVWYRCQFDAPAGARLRFEGLATIAEIFLDAEQVAISQNMFLPFEIELRKGGQQSLSIAFRSLEQHLARTKGRRARWKTLLTNKPNLRFVRTTLLGHMPGWCPEVGIVGPYRPALVSPPQTLTHRDVKLHVQYDGEVGHIAATISCGRLGGMHNSLELRCAGQRAIFKRDGDKLGAFLELPHIAPWTPHTHGTPSLHNVTLTHGENEVSLGKTGFRKVEIDRGPDATRFNFIINGRRIFARGAVWSQNDMSRFSSDRNTYRREFALMRKAGFNMVRIPGIAHFETQDFYATADEFGIMVWQDLPFANFDYPFDDPTFQTSVQKELEAFLDETQINPCIVAICGGSEVMQQAAMMGLARPVWHDCANAAAFGAIIAARRPEVQFIENSPGAGALPFYVDSGVGHYYGVGAYLRPLEDARRADVAFASECLAFSNVPDGATLDTAFGDAGIEHPNWKGGVPRDRGADWDFEDVREHYMGLLYGVDCKPLREADPAAYLAFARAATAETMEATIGEWRRPKSSTGGALVFIWKDLKAGAGWGLLDSGGQPKSVWHALRRACRPVNLTMTDEGVNGLHLHVINETDETRDIVVELTCLAGGEHSVANGERHMRIEGRGSATLNAVDLLGAFFDVNYAYRFGPPAHDVVVASLHDAPTQSLLAQAFYFPQGRKSVLHKPKLSASLVTRDEDIALSISCQRFAQTIAIDAPGFLPDDNYFHLAPGKARIIRFERCGVAAMPKGSVACLGTRTAIAF